jgi:hypothetical protein
MGLALQQLTTGKIRLRLSLSPALNLGPARDPKRRLVAIADKARSDEGESEPLKKKFLTALKMAWADGTPRPAEQRPAQPSFRWVGRAGPRHLKPSVSDETPAQQHLQQVYAVISMRYLMPLHDCSDSACSAGIAASQRPRLDQRSRRFLRSSSAR